MPRGMTLVAVLAVLLSVPHGGTAESQMPLAVRKVVLYKNGIGYFEHVGEVRGAPEVQIVLPSAQLDDVLKSLTVIDLGHGQVAGVTYDAAAPLDRRLAELPIDLSATQGVADFLNQVRGTKVEIAAPGGPVVGRLMGAEVRPTRVGPDAVVETIEAAVFTPQGELRIVELAAAGSLRFPEGELVGDLRRYLELLDSAHRRDVRRLRIHTVGSGVRQLYVSYTAEVPIWKTTYRIVLGAEQRPLLQGWAIVDNTTSMDWKQVELSLVAGAPVSFVQNLSQPLYARRPIVPLPDGVRVTPQAHEATLEIPTGRAAVAGRVMDANGSPVRGAVVRVLGAEGTLAGQGVTDDRGRFEIGGLVPGSYAVEASHPALGESGYREVRVQGGRVAALDFSLEGARAREERIAPERDAFVPLTGPPAAAPAAPSPREGAGIVGKGSGEALRQQPPRRARAQALGEQFEYTLPTTVTIPQNQSALLPIIHAEVDGQKVSLFNETWGGAHPRLAVWLRNTSGLTLDAGSFTVIDDNAFAGEGLAESISPQERRLLSYALDLGVQVSTSRGSGRERIERVEIVRGVMRLHGKIVEKNVYTIRNRAEKTRTIVLEHPVRAGWTLVETPPAAETTASYYRFVAEVKPKTTTEFTVREENARQTTYAIRQVTPEQIGLWVRQRTIDAAIEQALGDIVAQKGAIDELRREITALGREEKAIFRDQERVRENLNRLGRTPEEANLRLRYVRQLEEQENRLGTLRADRARLEEQRAAAQRRLEASLEQLAFERRL